MSRHWILQAHDSAGINHQLPEAHSSITSKKLQNLCVKWKNQGGQTAAWMQ